MQVMQNTQPQTVLTRTLHVQQIRKDRVSVLPTSPGSLDSVACGQSYQVWKVDVEFCTANAPCLVRTDPCTHLIKVGLSRLSPCLLRCGRLHGCVLHAWTLTHTPPHAVSFGNLREFKDAPSIYSTIQWLACPPLICSSTCTTPTLDFTNSPSTPQPPYRMTQMMPGMHSKDQLHNYRRRCLSSSSSMASGGS